MISMITAHVCCNATNKYTWPMLIYPGTQFRGFKPQEVFEDYFIARSKNGWTNQNLFIVINVFVINGLKWYSSPNIPLKENTSPACCWPCQPSINSSITVLLGQHVILYCIPPHSSHILQPLDVGVFKTMKAEWRAMVKRQNETEIVTKRTFAKTFKDAKNL